MEQQRLEKDRSFGLASDRSNRSEGPDVYSHPLDSLFLGYVYSVLQRGREKRGMMALEDLPNLPEQLTTFAAQRQIKNAMREEECDMCPKSWIKNDGDKEQSCDRALNLFMKTMCLRAFALDFLYLIFLKCFQVACSFAGPLLLNWLVSYVSSGPEREDLNEGLVLVVCLALSFLLSTLVNTQFSLATAYLQVKIRGALTQLVFSRALSLPQHAWTDLGLSDAQLTTIVQVDLDRVSGVVGDVMELWAMPLQIAVTFVLLWQQVGLAFLAGVLVICVMLPVNAQITYLIRSANVHQMAAKDERLLVLMEALRAFKALKLLGLERFVRGKSQTARDEELRHLATCKYLDAWCVLLWASLPVVVPLVTFGAHLLLAHLEHTQSSLSGAEVFTTLALLNMLIFPMNAFPWVVNGCVEAAVSLKRVVAVLGGEGGKSLYLREDIPNEDGAAAGMVSSDTPVLELLGAHWTLLGEGQNDVDLSDRGGGEEQQDVESRATNSPPAGRRYELGPIELRLSPKEKGEGKGNGQLVGVCGNIASGKSTFLLGCLGELALSGGQMQWGGSKSYCPQLPPVFNGSVRENVLFGAPLDQQKYITILAACSLNKGIRGGDLGSLGQAGSALSGGQRLLMGVARALYARTDAVLLDDPFSALDAETARRLSRYLKEISTRGRLVIVSTHSTALLTDADAIINLTSQVDPNSPVGGVANLGVSDLINQVVGEANPAGASDLRHFQGKAQLIKKGSQSFSDITTRDTRDATSTEAGPDTQTQVHVEASAAIDIDVQVQEFGVAAEVETEEERMLEGHIKADVYRTYALSMGVSSLLFLFVSMVGMQASANLVTVWYAYWSDNIAHISSASFMKITGAIAGANVLFAIFRSFLFARGGLQACRVLYENLSDGVFNTSMVFFDGTSIGRIINRFGKDTNIIDDNLPHMLNIVIAQLFALCGSIGVIIYTNYYIVVVLVGVIMAYYKLQKFYRYSSRGLRRLESIQRSPLYTLMADALGSGPVIRAQNAQSFFCGKVAEKVDEINRVNLTITAASQWLSMRLQLMGGFVAVILTSLAIFGAIYDFVDVRPGSLGLSLIYSFGLVGQLNSLVGSLTSVEQEIISVERVLEYSRLPRESESEIKTDPSLQKLRPPPTDKEYDSQTVPLLEDAYIDQGPAKVEDLRETGENNNAEERIVLKGHIQFTGVSMRYNSKHSVSPDAVSNLSVDVPFGSKLAIMGRTGSGKSSIFRILSRLDPYYAGSCEIDSHEVSSLSIDNLRNQLGVIPQEPILFTGSVRNSIDPLDKYSDESICQALMYCGLAQTFGIRKQDHNCEKKLHELLDMHLVGAGSNISLGQKQLLSLGRVFLRKSPIIMCDEITSSIDGHSRQLIYDALNKFHMENMCTLLIITHSLQEARLVSDRVLTLQDGKVLKIENIE